MLTPRGVEGNEPLTGFLLVLSPRSIWRQRCIKILWLVSYCVIFFFFSSCNVFVLLPVEAFSDRRVKTSHWDWIYNHRWETVPFFWKQPVSSHENTIIICTCAYIKNWLVCSVFKLDCRNTLQSVAHIWTCWTPVRTLSKLTLQWCKL